MYIIERYTDTGWATVHSYDRMKAAHKAMLAMLAMTPGDCWYRVVKAGLGRIAGTGRTLRQAWRDGDTTYGG